MRESFQHQFWFTERHSLINCFIDKPTKRKGSHNMLVKEQKSLISSNRST